MHHTGRSTEEEEYRDDSNFVFQDFLRKKDLNPTTNVFINPKFNEGENLGCTFHQLISNPHNENTELFHTLQLLNTNVVNLVYRIEQADPLWPLCIHSSSVLYSIF